MASENKSITDLAKAAARSHHAGSLEKTASLYRALIVKCPLNAGAWNNLGAVLLGMGSVPDSLSSFAEARRLSPDNGVIASNYFYALLHSWDADNAWIFRRHVDYGLRLGSFSGTSRVLNPNRRRLRIGYISPGFGAHAEYQWFCSTLRNHNSRVLDVYCYSTRSKSDRWQLFLKRHCRAWFDIAGLSDDEAASLILSHKVDILVDRCGYVSENRVRLLARRLAPVQVSTVNYPATLGLANVDYHITDPCINPEGTEQFYRERLVRVPVGMCYMPPKRKPAVGPLAALGNGFLTFAVFHRLSKFSPAIVSVWARILAAVPRSRLILHHSFGGRTRASADLRRKTEEIFRAHGVSPRRLRWVGLLSHYDTLCLYRDADITLDSHPYSGVTTTAESLFMGVPVVTLLGERTTSRPSAMILKTVGLEEFITDSPDAYVETAVNLANDTGKLTSLRKTLRRKLVSSPLCDAATAARYLEAAYREMWKIACSKA